MLVKKNSSVGQFFDRPSPPRRTFKRNQMPKRYFVKSLFNKPFRQIKVNKCTFWLNIFSLDKAKNVGDAGHRRGFLT